MSTVDLGDVRTNAGGGSISRAGRAGYTSGLGEARGVNTVRDRSGPETTRGARMGNERQINRSPEAKLLEESRSDFKKILEGDLKKLLEEHRIRGENDFNNWIRDAGKMHYWKLFMELTSNKDKEGRKGEERHIVKDSVDALMADERGLARVYDVMRIEYSEGLESQGLKGYMRRLSPRPGVMDTRNIRISPGAWGTEAGRNILEFFSRPMTAAEGRLMRPDTSLGGRIFLDKAGKVVLTVAGATVALGTAAALTVSGVGLIVGAAAAPSVVAGIFAAIKRGETYQHEVVPAILERVQKDTARVAWNKRFHGVDPNDFQETPRGLDRIRYGRIRVNPNSQPRTILPKETRTERSNAMMNAIIKFQRANRIPEKYIEPMDVLWIHQGLRNPPQHGDDLQALIMERVDQTRDPTGGSGLREPNRPGAIDYNLQLYRNVQEQFLQQDLDFVFRTLLKGNNIDTSRGELAKRRESLRSGPAKDAALRTLRDEKGRIEVDKKSVSESGKHLKDYADRIKKAREDLERLTRERNALGARIAPTGGGSIAAADLVNTLIDLQSNDGSAVDITIDRSVRVTALRGLRTQLNTDINNALDPRFANDVTTRTTAVDNAQTNLDAANAANDGSDAAQAAVTRAQQQLATAQSRQEQAEKAAEKHREDIIKNNFQGRVTQLERQERLVAELLEQLGKIEEEQQGTQLALANPNAEDRRGTASTITAMGTSFAQVESWTVPPNPLAVPPFAGVDLSRAALRDTNLSFAQLLERSLQARRLTEQEMNDPAHRRTLTQAIAEARALEIIGRPLVRLTDVTTAITGNPPGAGISEDVLLNPARSDASIVAEITTEYNAIAAAGGTPPAVLSEIEVRDLRQALRITRDFEFVTNPDNTGLTYTDVLALTSQEVTERMIERVRFADVTAPAIFNIPEADLINPAINDATIVAQITVVYGILRAGGGTPPAALRLAEVVRLREAVRLRARNNMDAIKTEASRRLTTRQRALDTLATGMTATLDQSDAEIRDIEAHGVATHELNVGEKIISAANYDRINTDVRTRPLYALDALGRRNRRSIEELLATGRVVEADTQGVNHTFLPFEVAPTSPGYHKAYVNMLDLLLQHRSTPSSFTFGARHGEDAAFTRNRQIITPDMLREALRDHFNLTLEVPPPPGSPPGTPPGWRDVQNWDETVDILRYRMGLTWLTPPVVATPSWSPINITQDDFGSFLSEGILNIMMNRVPTADAVQLAVPVP